MRQTFCTAISCIDGRIQLPVIEYVRQRFDAAWVDDITQPAPNLTLAEKQPEAWLELILTALRISIEIHKSVGVAVVGHHDCARNPASREKQIVHIGEAVRFVRSRYPEIEVIGLWVDDNWIVNELDL